MKTSIAMLLLASLALGCGSKDSDKAAPPAAAATPAASAPAPAAAGAKPTAELPPECKEFTAAMERLIACEPLKASRDEMKKGYDQMLEAMAKLGDPKASAEGCQAGLGGLKEALKSAGC
jgi:hypothetical protein